MSQFLDKIADRLLRKFPEKMDNVAVVLPSKKETVVFEILSVQENKATDFFTPVFSVEEFVEKLSDLNVLDNISLQFSFVSILFGASSSANRFFFDEFLNWSHMLLHDFNEVDRSLVDPKPFFSILNK